MEKKKKWKNGHRGKRVRGHFINPAHRDHIRARGEGSQSKKEKRISSGKGCEQYPKGKGFFFEYNFDSKGGGEKKETATSPQYPLLRMGF